MPTVLNDIKCERKLFMYVGPRTQSATPPSIKNRLGKGKIEKGPWGKLYVWAWDFAEVCQWEDCNIYHLCEYKDGVRMTRDTETPFIAKTTAQYGSTNKCMMQQRYLKNVLHAIIQTLQKKKNVSTENMIRMGYQMIPLYAQLYKFKKFEFTNNELTYISDKGAMKVNPIYKEIREIIKTIEGIWIKIGSGIKDRKSSDEIGDGSYIDAMHGALGEKAQEYLPKEDESVDLEDGTGLDFDFGQGIVRSGRGESESLSFSRKRKKKRKKRVKKKKEFIPPEPKINWSGRKGMLKGYTTAPPGGKRRKKAEIVEQEE